jgi:hypothetical protein
VIIPSRYLFLLVMPLLMQFLTGIAIALLDMQRHQFEVPARCYQPTGRGTGVTVLTQEGASFGDKG